MTLPYKVFTTKYDQVLTGFEAADAILGRHAEFHKTEKGDLSDEAMTHWEQELGENIPDVAHAEKPERILLDLSGSMRGPKILHVVTAVLKRGDALTERGVPFEVLGFTTSSWKGGKSRADWIEAGRPQNPGRLCDLLHIVFKGMNEDWADCRKSLAGCLLAGMLKENVDGEAVEWAVERSNDDMEPASLLIISDGAPVDDSTIMANTSNFRGNGETFLDDHLSQVLDNLSPNLAWRRVRIEEEKTAKFKRDQDVFVTPGHARPAAEQDPGDLTAELFRVIDDATAAAQREMSADPSPEML